MADKNKLAYSPLTEKVYWLDGKGKPTDVTQNFIQIMLCWITEGELPVTPGAGFEKVLTVDGTVAWTIQIRKGKNSRVPKAAKNIKQKV